jgi:hypothetical protein
MRQKSSIDKLPKELRAKLPELLNDPARTQARPPAGLMERRGYSRGRGVPYGPPAGLMEPPVFSKLGGVPYGNAGVWPRRTRVFNKA